MMRAISDDELPKVQWLLGDLGLNQQKAADALGVSHSTLRRFLYRHGMIRERPRGPRVRGYGVRTLRGFAVPDVMEFSTDR